MLDLSLAVIFGKVSESVLLLIICRDGISVNLAYNRLPIFDQSRLPITDILSVLSFTDTDNRYSIKCRYIDVSVFYRYIEEKSPKYSRYLLPIFGKSR